MSNATASLSFNSLHKAWAPTTPAAGPDSSMRTHSVCAWRDWYRPPVDCTSRKAPLNLSFLM